MNTGKIVVMFNFVLFFLELLKEIYDFSQTLVVL